MAWPLVWLESSRVSRLLIGYTAVGYSHFPLGQSPDHLITLSQVHCTHCDAAFWRMICVCVCLCDCVAVCDHYCRPLVISCCGCSLLPLIGRSLLQYPVASTPFPSLPKRFRLCCCCCLNVGCVFIACAPKNKLTCRIFTLTISGRLFLYTLQEQ